MYILLVYQTQRYKKKLCRYAIQIQKSIHEDELASKLTIFYFVDFLRVEPLISKINLYLIQFTIVHYIATQDFLVVISIEFTNI